MWTFVLATVLTASAVVPHLSAGLPPQAVIADLISGPGGTLYACGATPGGGFIAQLPDGYVYRTNVPISSLALGNDGSIYATGATADPATFGSTFPTSAVGPHAFALKLDPSGQLEFARVIEGPMTVGNRVAVNAAGEVLISGETYSSVAGNFPVTANAVAPGGTPFLSFGFLVKLDASGRDVLVSLLGYGGGPVAFDADGDLFTASIADFLDIRPTPGAFQSSHTIRACGGTAFLSSPCRYQYLVKISPTGTKLLYSTYLTGTFGAAAVALSIDHAGNATVAGTTYSQDYPVTSDAVQQTNRAELVYQAYPDGYTTSHPPVIPPASAGYISKLNADGTALLWSTYFGGTGLETIASARVDTDGNILISGLTASSDLPGAAPAPPGCQLTYDHQVPYLAKLSVDGRTLLGGNYLYNLSTKTRTVVAMLSAQEVVVGAGRIIASESPTTRSVAACLSDSADLQIIDQVVPGQLLTLFADFGTSTPMITVNTIAADVFYSGAGQINFRIPPDISGQDFVTITTSTAAGPVAEKYRVVAAAPSFFIEPVPQSSSCFKSFFVLNPTQPIARNDDGLRNACDHPAALGSVVTLFLNGVGLTPPNLSLKSNLDSTATIVSVEQDPASPAGVWRVQVRLGQRLQGYSGAYEIQLNFQVDQQPVRDSPLTIFAKAAP